MQAKLRDYQERAVRLIYERIKNGDRKTLLWLMTGGGKSLVFSKIAYDIATRNKSLVLVMRRRELVFQAHEHLKKWGISASVLMGNEKGFSEKRRVQIASIDTLARRIEKPKYRFMMDVDAALPDEAHDCMSASYQNTFGLMHSAKFIGFTATPFRVGNKPHTFWNSCVKPIEAHELRDKGYLVDAQVYAPKVIDVSGIRKIGGDFHQDELFKRVSEFEIIGDIVDTYKERGMNKPAILFAVNKKHSMLMAAAFNQAGIPAIHLDESHSSQERQNGIKALESGRVKVLCSVIIFSTGVDIPIAQVGIMARPTMSEVLCVQQWGRLLRPFPGKTHALILDHANNSSRHGLPYDVRFAELTDYDVKQKKKSQKSGIKIKICEQCFAVFQESKCPYCGYEKELKAPKEKEGELELVTDSNYRKLKIKQRWNQVKNINHVKKFYIMFTEFGPEVFQFVKFPEYLERKLMKQHLMDDNLKISKVYT